MLTPLERVQLRVEPLAADALLLEVARKVLGEAFREGGDQHPLAPRRAGPGLRQEGRHLPPRRLDADDRVDQAGRADDLLDHLAARHADLVIGRCRRDVHPLAELLLPLVEPQRPVVQGARQPEAVLDERALAAEVAREHPAHLGDGHVRLIDEHEAVLGEEVEQRVRRLPRLPAREVPRVILDPRAIANLKEHLDIITRTSPEPLGFEQLAVLLELFQTLLQFVLDRLDRTLDALLRQHEVLGRVDVHFLLLLDHRAGCRVDDGEGLDLVAEKLDPVADLFVGGPEFHHVAPDAELAAREVDVISVVLDVDEPQEHLIAVDDLPDVEPDHHLAIILGRAKPVDRGHASDDEDVVPADERARAGEAESLDLFVDRGVLLDVDVALGDVGFGLVVVVIADEVADGVLGEELAELAVELCGEGLVVG